MSFIPAQFSDGNSHFAAISDGSTRFIIDPLGQRGAFYSQAAAQDLSEAHALTANRLGIASITHIRKG